jgi:biotin carboxyl carrier protein
LNVDGETIGENLVARVAPDSSGRYLVVLEIDGVRDEFTVALDGDHVDVDGLFGGTEFVVIDPLPLPGSLAAAGTLAAPMPGTVVRTEVEAGASVVAGQPIVILEAMKMEHAVRAPQDGVVESVLVGVGDQVDIGQVLAVVIAEEAGAVSGDG